MVDKTQNLGLATNFRLIGGKFELTGGTEKVDDNVTMLLRFVKHFRIYKQDYVIDLYRYYQGSTNSIFRYKNTLRLSIFDIGTRHVPFATFTAVDIPIDYTNRRAVTITIRFSYRLRDITRTNTLKRIFLP